MIKDFDRFINENFGMDVPGDTNPMTETDSDSNMAKGQLKRTKDFAEMLIPMIDGMDDMEPWVQSKITKAEDYLNAVLNYYKGQEGITEASKSLNEDEAPMKFKRGDKIEYKQLFGMGSKQDWATLKGVVMKVKNKKKSPFGRPFPHQELTLQSGAVVSPFVHKDIKLAESVNEGKYGTFDNAEAKKVDKALDAAFKKFQSSLKKAHDDFKSAVNVYGYNGAKAELGSKSGFHDTEGREAIDYFAQKIISDELGIDRFGRYNTGWLNESVNERKLITKKHWDNADDNQKEEWLLTVFSDPDEAMEYIDSKWEDLPDSATSNMYEANFMLESVMGDIDRMLNNAKSYKEFEKMFFEEYGARVKPSSDIKAWLKDMYEGGPNESMNEAKVTKKSVSKASDDLAKIIIQLKDNLGKLQTAKSDEERAKYIEIAKDLTQQRKDASAALDLAIAKLDKNAELAAED